MSEGLQIPAPQISVGAITADDLREAASAGPSYEEQFGVSSSPLGQAGNGPQPTLAQLELEAAQKMAQATNPFMGMQGQDPNLATLQAQLEEYKKKYGDGENEKGQLRRERDELMEAFNGLSAQFDAMRVAGPGPGPQSYPQPQIQAPTYGGDPFADIADDDVLQGKQFKRFVSEQIAPAYNSLHSQYQQSLARQAALEAQLVNQTKANAGINRLTEFRLVGRNPWLNGLPEANRIAAMQSLLAAEKAQQPQAPTNGTTPSAAQVQDRILSRTTYIEGSNPQTNDVSQAALEASAQRDFAKAMSLPEEDGSRARALRALSFKNGWGWGAPSDLAR